MGPAEECRWTCPRPACSAVARCCARLSAAAIAASISGCADLIPQSLGLALTPSGITDPAVYNFALNLEYLEAEYYRRGVYGDGLGSALIGPDPGPVTGGRQVAFRTPYIREFMAEIAEDEMNHVRFLRQSIDASPLIEISRPPIDFAGAFRAAGAAAGLGPDFDPFADEEAYFLGSMLFEDVGITAYKGSARNIESRDVLQSAAGILAIEAYHMGAVRSTLYKMGERAARISELRDRLDGPQDLDQPIAIEGHANVVPANYNGIAFGRTPQHVLNIVYGTPDPGVLMGGFLPEGVNGRYRST